MDFKKEMWGGDASYQGLIGHYTDESLGFPSIGAGFTTAA
jgi:hypothetical protein